MKRLILGVALLMTLVSAHANTELTIDSISPLLNDGGEICAVVIFVPENTLYYTCNKEKNLTTLATYGKSVIGLSIEMMVIQEMSRKYDLISTSTSYDNSQRAYLKMIFKRL